MPEDVGTFPNSTEAGDGHLPKTAEAVGSSPQVAGVEYRVTVQEATRLLEEAGVPRTERTVITWCTRDAAGNNKLDAIFSVAERRHLINPESLRRVIESERQRQQRSSPSMVLPPIEQGASEGRDRDSTRPAEAVGSSPKDFRTGSEENESRLAELESKVLDLTITNKGKDYLIDQLRGERAAFIEQLQASSRQIGELETKLLALQAPQTNV